MAITAARPAHASRNIQESLSRLFIEWVPSCDLGEGPRRNVGLGGVPLAQRRPALGGPRIVANRLGGFWFRRAKCLSLGSIDQQMMGVPN